MVLVEADDDAGGPSATRSSGKGKDITTLVHELQQEGQWDAGRARVSFVPARVFEDAETGELLPAPAAAEEGVHVEAVRIVAE